MFSNCARLDLSLKFAQTELKMYTNAQVVAAWAQGKGARNRNMTTDGINLYSYAMPIGTTDKGVKIAIYASVSNTTAHHMTIAGRRAHVYVPAVDFSIVENHNVECYNSTRYGIGGSRLIPVLGQNYYVRVGNAYKTRKGAERAKARMGADAIEENAYFRLLKKVTCG